MTTRLARDWQADKLHLGIVLHGNYSKTSNGRFLRVIAATGLRPTLKIDRPGAKKSLFFRKIRLQHPAQVADSQGN
jgi:hypothetical protein